MNRISLNGKWLLQGNGYECKGTVPGSVYSFLLNNGLMEDPYYRDNETKAFELVGHEYSFCRTFQYIKDGTQTFLCCDGLDTLADIFINGTPIASTKNMHRAYRFDVTEILKNGENEIKILFHPVDPYIKERNAKLKLNGSQETLEGYGYLRKAHCMLGWDWGPCLPDMGIWKDIYLLSKNSAEITEFKVLQEFVGNKVFVTPTVQTDSTAEIKVTVISPDGKETVLPVNEKTEIQNPKLWWPNGLGEHPLYTFKAEVIENGRVVDTKEKKIGLRQLKTVRKNDEYGVSFYHEVNGVPFFAMGADYIPMDNILSRVTKERTENLIKDCIFANYNAIRVWGGGYYPDDYFFDLCDEYGIVVFMDFMFACSVYKFDDEMKEEVKVEVEQNLMRIRHHACLAVLSGNNEIEQCFTWWYYGKGNDEPAKKEYLEVFEKLFPEIVEKVCPEITYVSSSPTSHGGFVDPQNENIGDAHYWDVWHGGLPFAEYRKHYFRYLSEFGFQSLPCEKTIEAFTLPEDRNIFSYVMEKHQRNDAANGKIMGYMSQTFLYPTTFSTLVYASQLLQAEAIKCGVEHLRRNRGRCMGTLYWQLNDIWPVASWSSVDYYGRYKALHYYAKRFYSPIAITCEEQGEHTARKSANTEASTHPIETSAKVAVHNDTLNGVKGVVTITLRNEYGKVIKTVTERVELEPMSVKVLEKIDFGKTDYIHNFVAYSFESDDGVKVDGTSLMTNPKFYKFVDPELKYELNGDEITVYAKTYAKSVEITADEDIVLSDNYFDIYDGKKVVKILKGKPTEIKLRSVYDIK